MTRTITTAEYVEAAKRAALSGRTVAAELGLDVKGKGRQPWSAATPKTCEAGHRHPSKIEARVCDVLTASCARAGATLLRQARLPVWALGPDKGDVPFYHSVDFAVVLGGRLTRLVDAKGRVSRDWRRGAAAVRESYGIEIEEVTSETVGAFAAAEGRS